MIERERMIEEERGKQGGRKRRKTKWKEKTNKRKEWRMKGRK